MLGRLVDKGWGAKLGFPALELDDEANRIEVDLLQSADLPDHWQRLDAFEGEGYRRVVATIQVDDTSVEAWIYVTA